MIQVFYRIQKQIASKLVMVGDGPELEPAEQLVRKLGIEESVIFLGKSNEVDKILCFSDLFLLPSETESFGLAALEAMASGVPVISSNTGGIPEVNIEGVSGYLADVGDVEKMAFKAIEILQDEKVLSRFKNNAKEVAKQFDLKTIVRDYEALYINVLKQLKFFKMKKFYHVLKTMQKRLQNSLT
jgi:N-acetyl-alpha-D-glucosaminyl L-malate synthase BshA